jgi:hypothetical protein
MVGREREATERTLTDDDALNHFDDEATGERPIVDDGTPRTSSQLVAIVAEVGQRLVRRSVAPPPAPPPQDEPDEPSAEDGESDEPEPES